MKIFTFQLQPILLARSGDFARQYTYGYASSQKQPDRTQQYEFRLEKEYRHDFKGE